MKLLVIALSLVFSSSLLAEVTNNNQDQSSRGQRTDCDGRGFDSMSGAQREAYFQCLKANGLIPPPPTARPSGASSNVVAIASCRFNRDKKFELLVYEKGKKYFHRWPTSPGRQATHPKNGNMRTILNGSRNGSKGNHVRALGNLRGSGRHHIVSGNKTYAGAPMYNAVWIGSDNGFAVHGTTPSNYSKLGYPASSGCLRLKKDHSRQFYDIVKKHGMGHVQIHFDGYDGCVGQNGKISKVPDEKRNPKVDALLARYFQPKDIPKPRWSQRAQKFSDNFRNFWRRLFPPRKNKPKKPNKPAWQQHEGR